MEDGERQAKRAKMDDQASSNRTIMSISSDTAPTTSPNGIASVPATTTKCDKLDKEHRRASRHCDASGLRCVAPYAHSYTANAKRRWVGQGLADFYSKEYGALDRGYVEQAIRVGAIRVNGKAVPPSRVIRDCNKLERWLHHHEPRVPGEELTIIAQTPDLIVASKPAGIPVHASGPYRYNTLLSLLVAEKGFHYSELNPVHRLDRLTSGLVLLARTKAAAQVLGKAMMSRDLRKRYIAEVEGEFPLAPQLSNSDDSASSGASASSTLDAIAKVSVSGGASIIGGSASSSSDAGTFACDWPFLTDLSAEAADAAISSACPFLKAFTPSAIATGSPSDGVDEDAPAAAAASENHASSDADGLSTVAWTGEGWLRVCTGIAGIDIKNCVAGVVIGSANAAVSSFAAASSEYNSAQPAVAVDSKVSVTLFRRLAVVRRPDPSSPSGVRLTSLIEAAPLTGRTHQIRVHAAWLGFPIIDDPLYCPATRARLAAVDRLSADVRRQDATHGRLQQAETDMPSNGASSSSSSSALSPAVRLADFCAEQRDWEAVRSASVPSDPTDRASAAAITVSSSGGSSSSGSNNSSNKFDGKGAPVPPPPSEDLLVSLCAYCSRGPGAEFNASQLICRGLRLHSLAYHGPGWAFACPPPEWAAPYWQ